jgi:hypothetical protein
MFETAASGVFQAHLRIVRLVAALRSRGVCMCMCTTSLFYMRHATCDHLHRHHPYHHHHEHCDYRPKAYVESVGDVTRITTTSINVPCLSLPLLLVYLPFAGIAVIMILFSDPHTCHGTRSYIFTQALCVYPSLLLPFAFVSQLTDTPA